MGLSSTVGFTGFASAREADINEDTKKNIIDSIYGSPEVRQIKQEFDKSDIEPTSIKSVITDSRGEIVAANISVNDGTLAYFNFDSAQAKLIFNKRKPNISKNWPANTEGLITATADNVTFFRTVSQDEKKRIINGIGKTKIDNPNVSKIIVDPEARIYLIDKYDYNNKEIETIKASSSKSKNGVDYRIIENELFGSHVLGLLSNQSIQQLNSQSDGCTADGETAAEVILCLTQAITCRWCLLSGIGGPKAVVACILLICLGTPSALEALIDELDNPCASLVGDLTSCWDKWTSFY